MLQSLALRVMEDSRLHQTADHCFKFILLVRVVSERCSNSQKVRRHLEEAS